MDLDPTEQTGTGTPRSADDHMQEPGADAGGDGDTAIVTGATTSSHPAHSDEVVINRSGSGGSGGPTGGDETGAQEGSGSRSMEEMLGATPGEAGQAPE